MSKLIQICASENDLFGLDVDEGVERSVDVTAARSRPPRSSPPAGTATARRATLARRRADRRAATDMSSQAGCHAAARTVVTRLGPTIATVLVAALCAGVAVARADVPTVEDIVTCNRQAEEGLRGRSISPTAKDEADADSARRQDERPAASPSTTAIGTQSPDPQIHGMDRAGAKDAAYRAAYRVCMRRRGF